MSMKPSRKNIKSILQTSLIILMFIGYVGATSSPLTNTQGEAGSFVKNCTWTIYLAGDGSTILSNYGGTTSSYTNGLNVFSSTTFSTVWYSTINAVNGNGGRVCIGPGTFTVDNDMAGAGVTAPHPWNNLEITGTSATILKKAGGSAFGPVFRDTTVSVSNFTVSGTTFDGSFNAGSGGIGLFVIGGLSATFYNINFIGNNFRNCYFGLASACLAISNAVSGSVIGNTFSNSGTNNTGATGSAYTTRGLAVCCSMVVAYNHFTNIFGTGVSASYNNTITSNWFFNAFGDDSPCGSLMCSGAISIFGDSNIVSSNVIYYSKPYCAGNCGNGVLGIYVSGSHESITGNTITFNFQIASTIINSGVVGIWADDSNNLLANTNNVISSNTIYMNFPNVKAADVAGILLGGTFVSSQSDRYALVSGNTIDMINNISYSGQTPFFCIFNENYLSTTISLNKCHMSGSNIVGSCGITVGIDTTFCSGFASNGIGAREQILGNTILGFYIGISGAINDNRTYAGSGVYHTAPSRIKDNVVNATSTVNPQAATDQPFGKQTTNYGFVCGGSSIGIIEPQALSNNGNMCFPAQTTLVDNKDYFINAVDVILYGSVSGGGCSITIKDPTLQAMQTGLTSFTHLYLPVGWDIATVGSGCTYSALIFDFQ